MRELNRIPVHAAGKATPGRTERPSDNCGLFVIKSRALDFHAKKESCPTLYSHPVTSLEDAIYNGERYV